MKKKTVKKLALSKETVRGLEMRALERAAGGLTQYCDNSNYNSC